MKYQKMKSNKILAELDSEEKARSWIWWAKFNGKEFFCVTCCSENFINTRKIQNSESAKTVIHECDAGQIQFFKTQSCL